MAVAHERIHFLKIENREERKPDASDEIITLKGRPTNNFTT